MKNYRFALLLLVPQLLQAQDMSHCLQQNYVTPAEADSICSQYTQFHQLHRLDIEGATDDVLAAEAEQLIEMVNLQKCMMDTHYKAVPPYKRAFHNKAHGCGAAHVRFLGNGEGVFAFSGVKSGVVRFSNGAINASPDGSEDIRGFALKVQGMVMSPLVDTASAGDLDFLLINMRNLPSPNFADFMTLTKLGADGLLGFFEKMSVYARLLASGLAGEVTVALPDVKAIAYHSASPYRYGQTHVAKYRVNHVSCLRGEDEPTSAVNSSGDNFLAERLAERLRSGPMCFEFAVQTRSFDDPSLDLTDDRNWWQGDDFRTVATIQIDHLIPPEHCEALQFNPWHTSVLHKPLGSVNRARVFAYQRLSNYRKHMNGSP